MPEKMDRNILLTITMLVSDRPDTIGKCLESMRPLLDAVPSELIVVDTAGNEECLAIVREHTDKIVHFKWCNDFAAARNAGLKKARGQWIMYIDDDEWFEDISELRDFFLNGVYRDYVCAGYLTRNYMDKQGKAYQDRVAVRLCKREKNTRFVGRIHEQLDPLCDPVYYFKAYVHHYGYAFESDAEQKKHSWRNIKLLIEAREAEADNWKAGAHLIQEYFSVGELFSLIAVARELRLNKNSYEPGRNDFTAYASVMEMTAYVKLKRLDEAYELGKNLLAEKRALLLCHICVACMMGDVCMKQAKYEEALHYVELFRKYYRDWKQSEELNAARDAFSVHKRFLNDNQIGKLDMIELHVRVRAEEWEQAEQAFLNINWLLMTETLSNTFADIVALITHRDYRREYGSAMEILLNGAGTREYLCRLIDDQKGEAKERVLYCISQIPSKELQILQYRLEYMFCSGDIDEAERLLDDWKEKNYSFFLPDREYWRGLRKLKIDLMPWISDVRIHEWIHLTEVLFEQFSEEDCENVYHVLVRGLGQTDIRSMHITALRLEKRLLSRNMNLENLEYLDTEEIWTELYRIASLWVSCAAMLYQERIFQSELQSALPARYQFAWLIFQANAVKADSMSFVRKIGEAAKCYLRMEGICKYFLRYYRKEAEE